MAHESNIIELRTNESGAPAQLHLMPCRIEHKHLPIKAAEYFWPTIRALKEGGDNDQGRSKQETQDSKQHDLMHDHPTLTASFRGRPLQGRKVSLPSGFSGHVIGKDPRSTIVPTKQFREFTYWNWDELPSDSDAIVQALRWINISKAIHDD